MRKGIAFIGVMVMVFALVGCKKSVGTREDEILKKHEEPKVEVANQSNAYDFTYDGLTHRILVFCPDVIDENTDLMIMLHGYGSSASEFKRITGMDEDAVKRNYIVVYVTGAPEKNDPYTAYGWNASWNSGLTESDKDDLGLLIVMTEYMRKNYELASGKAFVVGYSNGGFMTYRLALDAPKTFTACASVAGKMTDYVWNARNHEKAAGMLQINGTLDDVVPMKSTGSDQKIEGIAIEDVLAYLADVNQCTKEETYGISDKAIITKYYGSGVTQIWDITIDDLWHCWPNEEQSGFDINDVILDYFEMYR